MAGPSKRGPKPKDPVDPTPLKGVPAPPGGLDAVAKNHWKALTGMMAEAGLISRLDRDALVLYINLWSRWQHAELQLKGKGRNGGPVITAPNGYRQLNPWYTISLQCLKEMRTYQITFGLTPGARTKLALPEPEVVDDKWREPE